MTSASARPTSARLGESSTRRLSRPVGGSPIVGQVVRPAKPSQAGKKGKQKI